jgi:glutamate racemase
VSRDVSTRLVIGVRDSGVGGLTVARCIRDALPHASLLYFADTAHVPYGERTPDEIRHYALNISRFLIQNGATTLIFACNTSSALALELARQTFEVPIYGTIEPGARAAVETSRSGRIGVLATHATVSSGVYSQWIKQFRPGAQIWEIACPEFVPLVESENTDSDAARKAAEKYLAPLLEANCDTVVLGCTHYPLLLPVLRAAAPHLNFVDPAQALACELKSRLNERCEYSHDAPDALGATRDIFFASGDSDGLRGWIDKLLPQPAPDIRRGPVFDLDAGFRIQDA